jgi:hypothetical protein
MSSIEISLVVGYLIVYMYLGLNLLMMILEKRVKFSLVNISTAIEQLLSKEFNPKEYVRARIYFWGTFLMLALGMILLSLA